MAAVDVRPAHKSDIEQLAGVLGRAFHDDPVMVWMLPEAARRKRALARMFATMTRHHFLAGGGSEVALRAGAIGAAALWDPPGCWRQTPLQELLMMPGFARALGRRAVRGKQIAELMKKHHPDEPHWYLAVIGSDPTVRSGGFGHALLRSRLDRVDAEHAPAYLESSNPHNVPYYSRFGFEVTGEIALPDGGPTMTPMWRAPR
ncbi:MULTISPECIES: GNAT family N-acetyltransferase [unclassified Mycolicibacterium]|uniref:GNAT family N-acetyltransferase n=1 Tax=unclassified Mycolicibacterium TaxID=2636767 RepID=UPI0012DE24FF|nr:MULTISPECIES: GNAT family N-acetyltransferase [unclassified Mycolicibacterium]MUL83621.1 GNAT family N-acetyltransferase [Mycolicibacterium sp. CBMA 329]MUL90612.1 GNAT family N-acetyltransferase [Mycolicibacterium sp. CBMA 331]MUM00582.1 GNAT family N-acetyltransferase [Mycolicibacterium sp. CBMA 334]MUM25473.1 GNAT family N-acetyltransferase [Mycolicibacterium sp. CBMA 295]MUM41556.1 GNAT family N-acetyltransferase [Mycolicibacterium sp. CBMA 247]